MHSQLPRVLVQLGLTVAELKRHREENNLLCDEPCCQCAIFFAHSEDNNLSSALRDSSLRLSTFGRQLKVYLYKQLPVQNKQLPVQTVTWTVTCANSDEHHQTPLRRFCDLEADYKRHDLPTNWNNVNDRNKQSYWTNSRITWGLWEPCRFFQSSEPLDRCPHASGLSGALITDERDFDTTYLYTGSLACQRIPYKQLQMLV